jgi:hypothetical protein
MSSTADLPVELWTKIALDSDPLDVVFLSQVGPPFHRRVDATDPLVDLRKSSCYPNRQGCLEGHPRQRNAQIRGFHCLLLD